MNLRIPMATQQATWAIVGDSLKIQIGKEKPGMMRYAIKKDILRLSSEPGKEQELMRVIPFK